MIKTTLVDNMYASVFQPQSHGFIQEMLNEPDSNLSAAQTAKLVATHGATAANVSTGKKKVLCFLANNRLFCVLLSSLRNFSVFGTDSLRNSNHAFPTKRSQGVSAHCDGDRSCCHACARATCHWMKGRLGVLETCRFVSQWSSDYW